MKLPELFNCKLYAPAPVPDVLMAPATVSPPLNDDEPMITVPAVMALKSAPTTEKVPPVPPTETDQLLFGRSVTVLVPALTLPEKLTS